MADYREISQEYAQGAIKAAFTLNGGAAIVVLSQFAEISSVSDKKTVAAVLLLYCLGVTFAAFTWLVGFASTRHVDRAERGQDLDYSTANNYQKFGLLMLAASVLSFVVGAIVLAAGVGWS